MRLVVRLHCRHSCYVVVGCYIAIAIANAISLLLLLPLLYRYCYCRGYITIAITDAILRLLLLMLYNYCRCYIAVAVADAMSLLLWLMLFHCCCCRCVIDVAGAIPLLLLPYCSLLPCRSLLLYRWRHCWFACWCCIAVSARSGLLLLGHHWAIVHCLLTIPPPPFFFAMQVLEECLPHRYWQAYQAFRQLHHQRRHCWLRAVRFQ